MTIPLMRYVQVGLPKKWQRHGMTAVMLLCALSALGSHSRGALVAIAAMSSFLWIKSRNKFGVGLALVCAGFVLLSLMPPEWFTRMDTIATYDEDESAQGRINAWWMAFNLARSRFLGGGFEIYDADTFAHFAPNPLDVHAAHSIYFQVLGEHGFVGLALFVSIGAFTWRAASDAKRKARGIPGLEWIVNLMDMVKVSMIGYGVGGAFLSLAYFDVPYYVMVIVVATSVLATRAHQAQPAKPGINGFVRERQFGLVQIADEANEPPPVPESATRPGSSWRGHGRFVRP
jgi:probable O-glycosylation ligase (exosortase A-associated)